MVTQPRHIYTSYTELAANSSSTMWHQDTETYNTTYYNILYYLTIENCRLDCGTDIAFRDTNSEIITIKLPIMEGLIIAIKDDCFSHKSPVITLLEPEKPGSRLIIRTYAGHQHGEDIKIKNKQISELNKELNYEKLRNCLDSYFNETIDESIRIDCYKFIKYYWPYKDDYEEIKRLFDNYYDSNKSFFDTL
jgi:hypothetical protein